MVDLSIVIACYKDGAHLENSLCEIERFLNQTQYTYEFIIIDDCSPDGSAKQVEISAAKRSHARMILHEQNVGRGGTVAEGMKLAEGTYVGYLDIDLEVHCRYITSMVLALEDGWDGAIAFRVYNVGWNLDMLFRNILSVGYRTLVHKMLKLPFRDTETGFKFFQREKILPILEKTHSPGWFWDTEVMARCHFNGLTICEIPALFMRRWDKTSTVRPIRDSIVYFRELLAFRKQLHKEGVL